MPRVRMLAVEDDSSVQLMLRHIADEEMLDLAVEKDGRAAISTAQRFKPDLAVVDVRLPGDLDGFAVARQLKDREDIAVLFLTGASDLEDRLAGFRAGGDDYVTKPFFAEEVEARIRAILRRRGVAIGTVRAGDLMVDEGTREVTRGDWPVALTRTEFEMLLVLVRNRGRVVSKSALANSVWGYGQGGNVLDVHMSALRRKLEAHGGGRCIHTVRSVGYVLRSAPT